MDISAIFNDCGMWAVEEEEREILGPNGRAAIMGPGKFKFIFIVRPERTFVLAKREAIRSLLRFSMSSTSME